MAMLKSTPYRQSTAFSRNRVALFTALVKVRISMLFTLGLPDHRVTYSEYPASPPYYKFLCSSNDVLQLRRVQFQPYHISLLLNTRIPLVNFRNGIFSALL